MRRLKILAISIAMVLAGCFSLLPVNTAAADTANPLAIMEVETGGTKVTYYVDTSETITTDTSTQKYYASQTALLKSVFGTAVTTANGKVKGLLQAGDKVKLLANTTYTVEDDDKDNLVVSEYISLDLNGKTLSTAKTFQFKPSTTAGTTEVKNGIIAGAGQVQFNYTDMSVVIKDVDFKNTGSPNLNVINRTASLTVENCTFNNTKGQNLTVQSSNATIRGTLFTNAGSGTGNINSTNNAGTISVDNCTLENTDGNNIAVSSKSLTINNSDLTNNSKTSGSNVLINSNTTTNRTLTITESEFNNKASGRNLSVSYNSNTTYALAVNASSSTFNATSNLLYGNATYSFRNCYFTLTTASPFKTVYQTNDYASLLDIDQCYLKGVYENDDAKLDVRTILRQSNSFVKENTGANSSDYPYIIAKDVRAQDKLAYIADTDTYYDTVAGAIAAANGKEVSILSNTTLDNLNCNINGMGNKITVSKAIQEALTSQTQVRNGNITFTDGTLKNAQIKNGKIVTAIYSSDLDSKIASIMDSNSLIYGTNLEERIIKAASLFSVKIGNVGYPNLQKALDNASLNDSAATKVNDSIVLLKDITTKGEFSVVLPYATFTLDLNGHKLSSTTQEYGLGFIASSGAGAGGTTYPNYANVTIKDSSSAKTGSISGEKHAIITNGMLKGITLTLDGIKLNSTQVGIYFPSTDGSELIIKDTQITGATGIALKGGSTSISGNTIIKATGAKSIPTAANANGAANTGDAIYIEGNYGYDITLNISGGTFTSAKADAIRVLFDTNNKAKFNITGGEFSSDVSSYVTGNYTTTKNGDLYTVGYKAVVKDDLPKGVEMSKETQQTLQEQSPVIINSLLESNTVSGEVKKQIQTAIDNGIEINIVPVAEESSLLAIAGDIDKVNEVLDDNSHILKYYDIKITLQIGGDEITDITELPEGIEFYIELDPIDIQDNRDYFVINIHNGVATTIDARLVGNRLLFKTDKFSTFAVGYKVKSSPKITTNKTRTTKNVQTGDTSATVPFTMLFMFSGAALLYGFTCYLKTRKES